jgi:predicted negative regulator of RcsB-dependent stress response
MDRITRSKLKKDRFAEEVEHSVEFVAEHRKQAFQYGAIAVAVALIVSGILYYRDKQSTARQEELAAAMDIMQAPVAPNGPPGQLFFTTEALKDAAATKAFQGIIDKHSSSNEATIAHSYMGALSMDAGNIADAEKHFQRVADSGDKNYASMGKLSLAQVYLSANRNADAEKLLRSVYEHPTVFVSKEQAALALARAISTSNPAEARKLVQPLMSARPAVSQAAITLLSQLPQK